MLSVLEFVHLNYRLVGKVTSWNGEIGVSASGYSYAYIYS